MAEGNMGCMGGAMNSAFEYVRWHELESESDYPYKAVVGKDCLKKLGKGVGKISGYTKIRKHSVDHLKAALMKGPVSIGVEADQAIFQKYTSGIIDSTDCGTDYDHGVLAVGYDTDAATGKEYFLIKNSWGAAWGESGYLRILADSSNVCGILEAPS